MSHTWHVPRSVKKGKWYVTSSCCCVIPHPGSFPRVLGVSFFNAWFQLELGMRIGWHNEVILQAAFRKAKRKPCSATSPSRRQSLLLLCCYLWPRPEWWTIVDLSPLTCKLGLNMPALWDFLRIKQDNKSKLAYLPFLLFIIVLKEIIVR